MKDPTRAKDLNETITIHCPKHGQQQTYDLYEAGKIKGVGCGKCFKGLKIQK